MTFEVIREISILVCTGDHSASIDSGVGASVSKSMDESGPGDETPPSVVQKRVSFPGPPPLLPKARSLDLHRDMHDDHDMVFP